MLAPMAGTILRILVKEGQRVKNGRKPDRPRSHENGK